MAISQELLDKLKVLHADISVLMGIVVSSLSDPQSSQTDWDNGIQLGTPGTDFPATTSASILTLMGTTLTVVTTADFTIGGTDDGLLILTDGVDIEIVSYDSSNATQFLNLVRGLYGTTQQSWPSSTDIYQLVWTHGEQPTYDLGIQKKNWIQEAISGSNPTARQGARMVYREYDGCYYMFGGYDGAVALNDLQKFDPSTQTWTLISPSGGPPGIRMRHIMALVPDPLAAGADEIWVQGGDDPATNPYADLWKYSFSGNSWSTNVAWDLANARFSHMADFWPGSDTVTPRLIITGGFAPLATKTTKAFDGTAWTNLKDAPFSWKEGDAAYLSDSDCVLVVSTDSAEGMRAAAYDPNLNSWTTSASPPINRRHHSLVADNTNNVAIMFGGTLDGVDGTKQMWSYSKPNNTWVELARQEREERFAHVAAWDTANEEMLLWGGMTEGIGPTFPSFPNPFKYSYFWDGAQFRTQTIDLGEVPTENGQWILEDIKDFIRGLSDVVYSFEHSDDAIAWTPVAGNVIDGQEITDLHRYYRVTVIMTNEGINTGPTVQLIDVNFDEIEWVSFANKPVDQFPPVIKNISSLSTQIDPLKATAKIGTMTVDLLNNSLWTQKLITDIFPRNNTVYIKVGVYEGGDFVVEDFTLMFKGKIKDWNFNGGLVQFKIDDFIGDFKKDIPGEDTGGVISPLQYNAGGIASHPVDIMEDIILNQLNVPDRNVDLDSFTTVRNDPSLTDWAFNRIITSPEDGYKLLQELSRHIGAVIILRETGVIALKILDSSDEPFDEWDERSVKVRKPKFNARATDTTRNFISTWWGWNGSGDEISDFQGAEVRTNAESVTNWGVNVLRTKSKWLGNNANPYFGAQRAEDISTRMLGIGKNGIPAITLTTCLGAVAANPGDIVRIQESVVKSLLEYIRWQAKYNPQKDLDFVDITGRYSIPYLAFGVFECVDMKFFVTKKQVNFVKGSIKWELHRAREVPLEKIFTTQDDFQQGTGSQVDFVANPGSVDLAIEGEGLYFESGTYEIVIDMTQQPEQAGEWTLTDTLPTDTSIDYEAWASETGDFLGEEMSIGTVLDADPITLKARYYKLKATLNANPEKTLTPSLDEISIAFNEG